MALSPQWLDELRARVTLSSVIQRTTKLQKAGHEWKACCPFHHEKSPSFTVSDQKGFYHCFAGETLVQTRHGRVPIAELAGKKVEIVTSGGVWKEAQFASYGTQKLWAIELTRNSQTKTIWATEGHRWFIRGRKSAILTKDLQIGSRLETVRPEKRKDWELDPEGVRHGIVFGDGSLQNGRYGHVNLHGEKDRDLARWFPSDQLSSHLRDGSKPYIRAYGGRAFEKFKQFPGSDKSEKYRLGFLAGYLAADGHVAKDGTVMLNSSKAANLETIRDLAFSLGISTYGVTKQSRIGIDGKASDLFRIHFIRSGLNAELFLLSEAKQRFEQAATAFARLRWVVTNVTQSERVEEVFCAEVPETHCFALADNILTGNCFGCGAHGDVIRWMTDQRGLGFMDAVKELALEAGMEVPAPDPASAKRAEQRAGLTDVMQAAQDWFMRNLSSEMGTAARDYLGSRGFDRKIVERFGFGFAPSDRQAMKKALADFDAPMLIEGGLRIAVDDKEPYDRFRARLMLPIQDARGRVIAFGGRILEEGTKAPKYLNSPDTPLFDKGRTLYNLHRAGPVSRQSDRLVVVEGYMDVIALANAGIEDAVAPLGTALTERQLEMLWRMVDAPILCFDGDKAGQRAAMRAIERALPMLKPGCSLRFVRLPSGMDPDDVIKRNGARAMAEILEGATGLLETLWDFEKEARPLQSPEDKAGLKARLLGHVDGIADQDIRALYRRELLDRFSAFAFPPREKKQWNGQNQGYGQGGGHGSGQNQPWKGGGQGFSNRNFPSAFAPPKLSSEAEGRLRRASDGGNRDLLVSAVLTGLARHPGQLSRHADALNHLAESQNGLGKIIDSLIEAAESLEEGGTLTILGENNIALPPDETRFTFLREGIDPTVAMDDLAEAVSLLVERPALEAALAAATERFDSDPEGAFAEQQRLLKRKLEFDQRLGQMVSERAARVISPQQLDISIQAGDTRSGETESE